MGYRWDAEEYSQASSQQRKWARELIAGLGLKGDERVLDVGCGDGKVTAEIASLVPAGSVTGVDASPEMIGFAMAAFPPETHPNLTWLVMDASRLGFEGGFDLVFSNATLHWVIDHRPVLSGIARALEPGGRAVLSMGGKGNAREVVSELVELLQREEWGGYFTGMGEAYGFHGPVEYAAWLEEAGLEPRRVELVPKDMTQPGREGLAAWIRTTWLPFTQRVPESERERFIYTLADAYLESHPLDAEGLAHVEMFRLEVEAVKPATATPAEATVTRAGVERPPYPPVQDLFIPVPDLFPPAPDSLPARNLYPAVPDLQPPFPQLPYPVVTTTADSKKATASLVLGIIGLFICPLVCSVLAIILGVQARNEAKASEGMAGGQGLAMAGMTLGIIGLVIWLVLIFSMKGP